MSYGHGWRVGAEVSPTFGLCIRVMVAIGARRAEVGAVDVERRRAGYIFAADPVGETAWRPDVANTGWAKARRAAGSAMSVRMHDLRHFQATQLLDAGVPVPAVAERLGHSDGTTTLKVYAHRTRKADQQAAEVVGNLLGIGEAG